MSTELVDAIEREKAKRKRRRPGRKELESPRPVASGLPAPAITTQEEREGETAEVEMPTKPPIILAKPQQDRATSVPLPDAGASHSPSRPADGTKQPVVMLRNRGDEGRGGSVGSSSTGGASSSSSVQSIPSMLASEGIASPTMPAYQIQRNPNAVPVMIEGASPVATAARLVQSVEMTHSVKLVDDTMQWCDNGMEMLQDQTDFFVVGVIGLQGTGKSTLCSMLAGNTPTDLPKSYVFRPQMKEVREVGAHQTLGIDMFITPERIIFLDTQPLLSPSVLDYMVHHEKKFPAEFTCAEHCIEMQSLQVATFLMTVCHCVIVNLEWFADVSLLRFLQTAEMLKPTTPSPGHDGTTQTSDDSPEYNPHFVFLLNKASRSDFAADSYRKMQDTLGNFMKESKLKVKGGISMANVSSMPGLSTRSSSSSSANVNLFILPQMTPTPAENDGVLSLLPEYCGHPGYEALLTHLRNQIYRLPRSLLTHTTLSEKNWFHYAARTWESVKKSQLLAEYNRLLP